MRRHDDDRALAAVERVRSVREQDSRIGLQHALGSSRERDAAVAASAQAIARYPAFGAGSIRNFRAYRLLLSGVAEQLTRAEQDAATGRAIAEEARRRWQQDHTRLRAVEALSARREAARREERDRRAATEMDDIAGQLWRRRHPGAGGGTR